jgi:hypothetical protein
MNRQFPPTIQPIITLNELKKKAHYYFDRLWLKQEGNKRVNRRIAYKWLSNELLINEDNCHIKYFDKEMCSKVIRLCSTKKGVLRFHTYHNYTILKRHI